MINELIMFHPFMVYTMLAILSLLIGSFLNVVIYRLPLILDKAWRSECHTLLHMPDPETASISLSFPRSFCPHCKTIIPFWHNIPLLSYCILLGRCRQCHTSISWRYPFIEALSLILSLFAAWHIGFNLNLMFALLFIWILIPLCFIDLQYQILPDSLTLGLLWLGLIANTNNLFTSLPDAVLSAVGAYVGLWCFIQLFYLITKKIGMGHGDFKLLAAFGAWFGWTQLPFILLTSSLLGAIVGITYLKISGKTHETPIPFGPFLCIAGLISLLFGQSIITWYIHLYI